MSTEKKVHGTGKFVPGSVKIVDYNAENNNLLIRGSAAFGADGFEMPQLYKAISQDPNYNSIGIDAYNLDTVIDFCLIGYGPGNTKDQNIVAAEAQWFNGDPSKLHGLNPAGEYSYPEIIKDATNKHYMIYWPVQSIAPGCPQEKDDEWTNTTTVNDTMNPSGYNFEALPDSLHAALINQSDRIGTLESVNISNAIIYVHCDSGINRTGAAVISYFMKYGSNIKEYGVKTLPIDGDPVNTLQDAQNAALKNQPEGNTPPGGVDQGIAEAYCNFTYTGSATSKLNKNCVPLPNTTD